MSIVKGLGFVKGDRQAAGKRLASHLKYMQYRPRGAAEEREDRHLFSQERDHVTRREALDVVMEHTTVAVNYHKLVLSPSKDESVSDLREWTRKVMRDLEQYKGQKLYWYATQHGNTDDPHVHLVLAGGGEDLRTGAMRPVKLYAQERAPDGRGDYEFLRQRGREYSLSEAHERDQQLAQHIQQSMEGSDRDELRQAEQEKTRRQQRDRSRDQQGRER